MPLLTKVPILPRQWRQESESPTNISSSRSKRLRRSVHGTITVVTIIKGWEATTASSIAPLFLNGWSGCCCCSSTGKKSRQAHEMQRQKQIILWLLRREKRNIPLSRKMPHNQAGRFLTCACGGHQKRCSLVEHPAVRPPTKRRCCSDTGFLFSTPLCFLGSNKRVILLLSLSVSLFFSRPT